MCVVVVFVPYPFVCYAFVQAELTFSAGDIIQVFGEMDEDGFFYVSVSTTVKVLSFLWF